MNWEKTSKVISAVTGLLVILAAIFGVVNYFAKDKEFQEFKTDTKVLQLEQQQAVIQQKVWDYTDRLKKETNPTAREELEARKRELEATKGKIDKRLSEVQPSIDKKDSP